MKDGGRRQGRTGILRKVGLASLVLSIGVFAGALATTWLSSSAPLAKPASHRLDQFSPASMTFDDAQKVNLNVVAQASASLLSPSSGTLTRLDCSQGASLASGKSMLSIDGAPKVVLATSVPLWRDLKVGDTGQDVEAIQVELSRLGFATAIDTKFGSRTLDAYNKLLQSNDIPKQDAVNLDTLIWLPAPTVSVAKCDASLGDRVTAGEKLIEPQSTDTRVQVASAGNDSVAGERVLEIGGVTVPIDASGAGLVPTIAIPSTDPQSDPSSDQSKQLTGVLRLKNPVEALSVPPGSIFGLAGNAGCVQAGNHSVKVTVLGSGLGTTYIRASTRDDISRIRLYPDASLHCQ